MEAAPEEISDYMQSCGFKKNTNSRYSNEVVTISDLLPRNVLADDDGDIYVIDDNAKRVILSHENGINDFSNATPNSICKWKKNGQFK